MKRFKEKNMHVIGKVLPDGTMIESVYDRSKDVSLFYISRSGKCEMVDEYYDLNSDTFYHPLVDTSIRNGVVLLPSDMGEESTPLSLFSDVKKFIKKYMELAPDDEYISALYVLNSYLYDMHEKVPYLRILGPLATGKSRLLKVLGAISYHSIFLGMSQTEAGLFRMIEKYNGGTIILDEANLYDTSRTNGLMKILNGGFERGGNVIRCDPNTYDPKSYSIFCPKILANHTLFDDLALESRMLTFSPQPLSRSDIPESLPPVKNWPEAQALRNRLLTFRLKGFTGSLEDHKYPQLDQFNSRLQEIVKPLLRTMGFNLVPPEVLSFMLKLDQQNKHSLSESPEAFLVRILIILREEEIHKVYMGEISKRLASISDFDPSPRKVGGMIRSLGIPESRDQKGYWIDPRRVDIKGLANRFGLN